MVLAEQSGHAAQQPKSNSSKFFMSRRSTLTGGVAKRFVRCASTVHTSTPRNVSWEKKNVTPRPRRGPPADFHHVAQTRAHAIHPLKRKDEEHHPLHLSLNQRNCFTIQLSNSPLNEHYNKHDSNDHYSNIRCQRKLPHTSSKRSNTKPRKRQPWRTTNDYSSTHSAHRT
jgi:hypothetical protein